MILSGWTEKKENDKITTIINNWCQKYIKKKKKEKQLCPKIVCSNITKLI